MLCKARIDHLKAYASGEQTDGMKTAWRQVRVDRMLVGHFLRAGHYTAAYKLSESSGIEVRNDTCHNTHMHTHIAHTHTLIHKRTQELVDVEIFLVCQRVEEALRHHDTVPCLAWCHENRSKLRRMKSTLEFQVRLQDFIEMVRLNKREQAIKLVSRTLCF